MANLTLICRNTMLFAKGHDHRQFFAGQDLIIYVIIFTQTISYYYLHNSATTVADIIFQKLLFSILIDYYFSEEATNKK